MTPKMGSQNPGQVQKLMSSTRLRSRNEDNRKDPTWLDTQEPLYKTSSGYMVVYVSAMRTIRWSVLRGCSVLCKMLWSVHGLASETGRHDCHSLSTTVNVKLDCFLIFTVCQALSPFFLVFLLTPPSLLPTKNPFLQLQGIERLFGIFLVWSLAAFPDCSSLWTPISVAVLPSIITYIHLESFLEGIYFMEEKPCLFLQFFRRHICLIK